MDFRKVYEASVEINRAGLAMMGGQCYAQAMDTFRDALQLMREYFGTLTDRGQIDEDLYRSASQKRLESNRRLSSPVPYQTKAFPVTFVSEDATAALEHAFFSEHFDPVPLIDVHTISTESEIDVNLRTVAVLYNFAWAHLALAETTNPENRKDLLRCALELFNFGHKLILGFLNIFPYDHKALILGIVVLRSATLVLENQDLDSPEYREELSRLRQNLARSKERYGLNGHTALAA